MADAVARAGIVNQVGLVLRHSPAFGMLKAIAADPSSGRPMSVVFRDDQFIPVQGTYRSTWRGDVTKAGAGTLLEHSIHDLDMLEHVLGPVAEVSARTAGFHDIPGIEDVATLALAIRVGRDRHAYVGLARRAGAPEPATGRVVLREGLRGARGRLVRARRVDDDRQVRP